MRRVLLVAAVLTVSLSRAEAAQIHQLFDGRLRVAIPDRYELNQGPQRESGSTFVRTGHCTRALAKALPDVDFDDLFLKMWFKDDICKYVRIRLITIAPPGSRTPDSKRPSDEIEAPIDSSPKQVHELLAKAFSTRWGKYSFSTFDESTGIGRSVNCAGAFVFMATRKIDNSLVVIEGMDLVEVQAANDDDVALILTGAQLLKP